MLELLEKLGIGEIRTALVAGGDMAFFVGTEGIAHFWNMDEDLCTDDIYHVNGRVLLMNDDWQTDTVREMIAYVNNK